MLVALFFLVASFFRVFIFGACLPAVTFLWVARLDFIAFLPLFLVAIHAV
jgi:hypothetical protein